MVPEDIDIDNNFYLLGITMGWDNKFNRVFVTKRDFVAKVEMVQYGGHIYTKTRFEKLETDARAANEYGSTVYIGVSEDGKDFLFEHSVSKVITSVALGYEDLPLDSYEDASFTVGYSPLTRSWISYYSFTPNYYVSMATYFQTGVNFHKEQAVGLWSHLLTNKSFQVFNGKKYPFVIELLIKEEFVQKRLDSFKVLLDVRRYHNDYDIASNTDLMFNYLTIYNYTNNTGRMKITPSKVNSLRARVQFPKVSGGLSNIMATRAFDAWSMNSFYNRVIDLKSNNPNFIWDINQIESTVSPKAIKHSKLQNRMRGDWFLARLEQVEETRFKFIYKWDISKTSNTRK